MRRRGGGRARLLAGGDVVGNDRVMELALAHGAVRAAIGAALVVDVLEMGAVGQAGGVGEVRRIRAVVTRVVAVGGIGDVDGDCVAEGVRDDALFSAVAFVTPSLR